MNTITQSELDALCASGQAIDSKGGYPAVVLHPDGSVTKIWARKKKWLSTSKLYPYAKRFIKNAQQLSARGITVPAIQKYAKLKGSHVRIVTYQGIEGESIRELLAKNPQQIDMKSLCQYILHLHEKGILFRGMHFGNIVQLDEGGYGLIDFTDVCFFRKPVPLLRRAANIAFPIRYRQDAKAIKKAGLPRFRKTYMSLLNLEKQNKKQFKQTYKTYKNR